MDLSNLPHRFLVIFIEALMALLDESKERAEIDRSQIANLQYDIEVARKELRTMVIDRDDLRSRLEALQGMVNPKNFDWERLDEMDLIPAIKLFRQATGLGLKEAKDAVEAANHQRKFRLRGGLVPRAYQCSKHLYEQKFCIARIGHTIAHTDNPFLGNDD